MAKNSKRKASPAADLEARKKKMQQWWSEAVANADRAVPPTKFVATIADLDLRTVFPDLPKKTGGVSGH
jgi:hypothetical protein